MFLARARVLTQRWRSSSSSFPPAYRNMLEIVRIEHDLQAPRSSVTYLPSKYRVPIDDAFPLRLHGYTLDVSELRRKFMRGHIPDDVVAALNRLKFVWAPHEYLWSRNLEALVSYKNLHGNLLVVRNFIVPDTDPQWPKDAWGLKLGLVVARLRKQGRDNCPAPRRTALDAIGFVWDWYDDLWNARMAALTRYKELHGDVLVPHSFVIPENDPNWPKEMGGNRLGVAVVTIRQNRQGCPPERKLQLDAMGFVWDCSENTWSIRMAALTRYKELYGHVLVPGPFVVPTEPGVWPEDLWHHRLGTTVNTIRQSRAICPPEREAELDAMGFVWHFYEENWNFRIQVLTKYKEIHGDVAVRYSYMVPSNDARWPTEFWGTKLGYIVTNLREREDICPPNRRAELDALGFIWKHKVDDNMSTS
ncbi:hypothetical protein SDRG_17057 [Saprolegnia diclina VS20]|uniref:Helicase-associated domain-containing protein n=1 Tax=Saprolegnia diclina (strain VS20) TaxID=1156394 RepID=T0PVM9_SAPDV|nr:hypothetical protein SDRG_17057 [Saprolegnia diclina VS20]EQC25065.1 hypothetical protein SDRG_17057 [Saprolegnia diclina VS20]|eukprot:XP_008621514.1 hypothetical protein SDRG_17057 [Saprolegnia diclina VS20]